MTTITSSDIYREHFERPALPIEPPAATVDALIDPATGGLRFANCGCLHSIPDHENLPPLPRAAAEIVRECGTWLSQLPAGALAVSALPQADEKALRAGQLQDEIEQLAATFAKQITSKAQELRSSVERMQASMRDANGDELEPALARRSSDFFHRLDGPGQTRFLGQAERAADHKALRAIATDELTRYILPGLDTQGLIDLAGELRTPRLAAMRRAYEGLANRLEANLGRLAEAAAQASHAAAAGVSPDRLALVRKAAKGSSSPR